MAKYVKWVKNYGLASNIYYIPFSVVKTDPFDLKKHGNTQPPPLEKKRFLRLVRDKGLFTH